MQASTAAGRQAHPAMRDVSLQKVPSPLPSPAGRSLSATGAATKPREMPGADMVVAVAPLMVASSVVVPMMVTSVSNAADNKDAQVIIEDELGLNSSESPSDATQVAAQTTLMPLAVESVRDAANQHRSASRSEGRAQTKSLSHLPDATSRGWAQRALVRREDEVAARSRPQTTHAPSEDDIEQRVALLASSTFPAQTAAFSSMLGARQRTPATLQEIANMPPRPQSIPPVDSRSSSSTSQAQQYLSPSAMSSSGDDPLQVRQASISRLPPPPTIEPPATQEDWVRRRQRRQSSAGSCTRVQRTASTSSSTQPRGTSTQPIGTGSSPVGVLHSSKPVPGGKHTGCECCFKKCECNPFEDGPPSAALQRSLTLMDTLYDLRRQNAKSQGAAAGADRDIKIDDPEDTTILKDVIAGTRDTAAEAARILTSLEDGSYKAAHLGGARLPTTLATQRAAIACKRKVEILQEVEVRLAEFKRENQRRDTLVVEIAFQGAECPPALSRIADFCDQYTHNPANPADDLGLLTNFDSFCTTFLLPAKHMHLVALREAGLEAGEWWVDKAMEYASRGADKNSREARLKAMNGEAVDQSYRMTHYQLKAMADVAMGSGLDLDSPKMKDFIAMMNDRLAEAVLEEAKKAKEKDLDLVENYEVPPVGPAAKAAEKIESRIAEAIGNGCPDCHPKLEQARLVVKALYHNDSERVRLNNRANRMAQEKKK